VIPEFQFVAPEVVADITVLDKDFMVAVAGGGGLESNQSGGKDGSDERP